MVEEINDKKMKLWGLQIARGSVFRLLRTDLKFLIPPGMYSKFSTIYILYNAHSFIETKYNT